MSSPSPGKRRMDTDVVKLYPFSEDKKNIIFLFRNYNDSYQEIMESALLFCVTCPFLCVTILICQCIDTFYLY